MKKALLLVAAVLVITGAASATSSGPAATRAVSITATGFNPEDVNIRPGDSVSWKNADTAKHQVVSDTGVFKSPVLDPGETFTHRFDVESSYSYHDAEKTSLTGTVNVLTNNVSVGVTRIRAVYRNPVRIFGSIPSGATGETVTLHIRQYGRPEMTTTVVTQEGTYEYSFRPVIRTEVMASWNGTESRRAPTIGVRPLVVFRPLNLRKDLFFVRVRAARSYARKLVRINRQNSKGVWVTTRIVRLNANGEKRFTGKFPRGVTKAQAWVGKTPGYVAGFSTIRFVAR